MKSLLVQLLLAAIVTHNSPGQTTPVAPEAYPAVKHGTLYMYSYYIPPAPGSTPWAPCWSPDGKSIAVGMQGSIWRIDPQTGSAVELTNSAGYAASPDWSPDGKWIVYTADYAGKKVQLDILNVATGVSHVLTDDGQIYLDPVFSPDGSRLAYVSTQPNGYFKIYVRGIRDGRWDGEAILVTPDHQYPRDRLYFGSWDMHTQPTWTPDGKELVFVSNRNVALGSGDIWLAPARENGIAAGQMIWREQTLYRTRPHISPDGSTILYSATSGGADQFNNLYILPITGGAPYKVTFGSFDHFHPRWSPDGQWIAYTSNEGGLPQLALLEVWGGAQRKVLVSQRHWRRPMGRLHVRVLDDGTGKPTAARILGLASDGRFYGPSDTYLRIGVFTGKDYFHTSGEFTMEAPPGRMTLEAVKGFEYQPGQQEVEIQNGKTTDATLALRRLVNMPAKGWYSGSTHVHMNYGGNLHNTPENTAAMADAEDLHFVHATASNKDNRVLDWQYFRPGGHEYPVRPSVAGVKVLVGEEYRPAFLGHTFLLGLQDHLISPFTASYEATALASIYPSNTDIFRKAKAQGAVTGYVHPFGDTDPLGSTIQGAKGVPVDAALGTLDALEWSGAVRAEMGVWQKLLNNDIALVPTGGEDSINDLHRFRTIGGIRTYVHLDRPFTVEAWVDGVRKGHTYFSTGPLIEFRVNGAIPGGVLHLPAGGGPVVLEGTVVSLSPLSKVAINHNGVLSEIRVDGNRTSARFRQEIRLTESAWFSLLAEGPHAPFLDSTSLLAGTNAIRVYVGDQKLRDRPSAEYFIRWIDVLRKETDEWLWWRSPQEKEHVLSQYEEARRVYQRLAGEAR
jgi:TolB protein